MIEMIIDVAVRNIETIDFLINRDGSELICDNGLCHWYDEGGNQGQKSATEKSFDDLYKNGVLDKHPAHGVSMRFFIIHLYQNGMLTSNSYGVDYHSYEIQTGVNYEYLGLQNEFISLP